MKLIALMPGLLAPLSAPLSCQKKAKEQVRRFRCGIRNYKTIDARGKHTSGRTWMKINIGTHWRLLSRNGGGEWELLTHERYNNEIMK